MGRNYQYDGKEWLGNLVSRLNDKHVAVPGNQSMIQP